jgi:catechol 2,3-dioxygenase
MPKVASLGHVGLYVRDIERSKAFYRDIIGLKISDENPKTGSAFMTSKDRLDEHHELLLIPAVRMARWCSKFLSGAQV